MGLFFPLNILIRTEVNKLLDSKWASLVVSVLPVKNRRNQVWADLDYKKAHLGTRWKANPFGGASHAKGIVLEKVGVEAKQPNSAIRKCACSIDQERQEDHSLRAKGWLLKLC